MELAAQLVSANVLALVEHAELVPILQRMDATPREQREAQPWLGVAHAWALVYTGQMERANTALALAENRLETLAGAERARISGHIAAVRAYATWVHGDQSTAVEFAEKAESLLPTGETAVRALNLATLGNALNQYGASQRSVEVLEQAIRLARQAGQSHVFIPAASALTYAYIQQGRLHQAHAICQESLAMAATYQQRTGQPLSATTSTYAELSSILVKWGEAGPATLAARQGLALGERWGQVDATQVCLLHLIESLALTHDFGAARQTVARARKVAQGVSPWFVSLVDQQEAHLWLDAGEVSQAARVARETVDAFPTYLEARLLLKQNRLDEALAVLERNLPVAQNTPSLETVRLGVIQALALFQKKDEKGALAALKWTLELGQAENRVATFIREGEPMEKLLRLALAKSICPEFTRKLLAVFEARRKPQPPPAAEALIEPLSERELEILTLLDGPLSTPEIAAQLVVSANTVRTHIKNIYGKLGVHGRSGAVRRAKELGLLM